MQLPESLSISSHTAGEGTNERSASDPSAVFFAQEFSSRISASSPSF